MKSLKRMLTWLAWEADQASLVKHESLDANSSLVGRTVHALFLSKCEAKALSLDSLIPRRFGFSRKSMRAKVEIAQQRS